MTKRLKDCIAITGLFLRSAGGYAIVEIEINGQWVEVVREYLEAPFSHIVETLGMKEKVAQAFVAEMEK